MQLEDKRQRELGELGRVENESEEQRNMRIEDIPHRQSQRIKNESDA